MPAPRTGDVKADESWTEDGKGWPRARLFWVASSSFLVGIEVARQSRFALGKDTAQLFGLTFWSSPRPSLRFLQWDEPAAGEKAGSATYS